MSLETGDFSVRLFIRALTNLKGELAKAEAHAAAGGPGAAELLQARLATGADRPDFRAAPTDPHAYTLADHVHWSAEGARLAITRLLGARKAAEPNDAGSFADLHRRIDTTIAYLRDIAPGDLEAGLDRTIVVEHRLGSTSAPGRQFLAAFAIPHFFYHVAAAHGIMRNQGVPLTMGDFLGNWGSS